MTIDTSKLPKPEYKISYDTTPSTAGVTDDSGLTVSFDASTNYGTVTAPSTPISINIGNDDWDIKSKNWPSEMCIKGMIDQFPSLKIQYDKFMTVYNLVKDEYEEPINVDHH
tara:strand:- start:130 stop:465 length:336 start_codon:yes stop_codon:yes gene_type:complete